MFSQNGCSVRLLNPHSYSHTVWSGLSQLQEYFGCVAGANVLVLNYFHAISLLRMACRNVAYNCSRV